MGQAESSITASNNQQRPSRRKWKPPPAVYVYDNCSLHPDLDERHSRGTYAKFFERQSLVWADEIDYYRMPFPRYSGWIFDAFQRHNPNYDTDQFLELAACFMHEQPDTGWSVFKDLGACSSPAGRAASWNQDPAARDRYVSFRRLPTLSPESGCWLPSNPITFANDPPPFRWVISTQEFLERVAQLQPGRLSMRNKQEVS